MIRWRTSEDNPYMIILEMRVDNDWVKVPMVDRDEHVMSEHPRDTMNRKKAAAKKLKEMAAASRKKNKKVLDKS